MPRKKRDDGMEQAAVRDYDGGMNMVTVCMLYGVCYRTLRGWLDRAGVEVRDRGRLDRGVVEGLLMEGESLRGVGRRLGVGRGRLMRLLGE